MTTAAGKPLISPTRLERFQHCATSVNVLRHRERDEWRLSGNLCRDRWCPACAATRRRRIVHALSPAFRHVLRTNPKARPRLVTLTVRHADEPLADILHHLKKCWRALTVDPWWKSTQAGGIWAIEIKPGRRGGWHPHLHAIVFSPWISARLLRKKWQALTGDSMQVDIRQVAPGTEGNFDGPLGYIAKYIGKPAQLAAWPLERAVEIVATARSVRLWSAWGCMADAKKTITQAEEDKYNAADWLSVAPLSQVVMRALHGHAESIWLLEQLSLYDWHLVRDPTQPLRGTQASLMPRTTPAIGLLPGP